MTKVNVKLNCQLIDGDNITSPDSIVQMEKQEAIKLESMRMVSIIPSVKEDATSLEKDKPSKKEKQGKKGKQEKANESESSADSPEDLPADSPGELPEDLSEDSSDDSLGEFSDVNIDGFGDSKDSDALDPDALDEMD